MIKINQVISSIFQSLKFENDSKTGKLKLICEKEHNYKSLFPDSVLVHNSFILGFGKYDKLYVLNVPNIKTNGNTVYRTIASETLDGQYITIMNKTYPMVHSEEEYFQRSLVEEMIIEYCDLEIINELKQYLKEVIYES